MYHFRKVGKHAKDCSCDDPIYPKKMDKRCELAPEQVFVKIPQRDFTEQIIEECKKMPRTPREDV